jgi:hypothetical protein
MPKHEPSPQDPMELIGAEVPTDEDGLLLMANCFIEEYVRMGYDDAQIMRLFKNPFFRGTHLVYQQKGEAFVRELIQAVREKWGYFPRETTKG